ncbi:MAG: hypothetical protein IJK30_09995 [Ruminococcus sp.]|nr:hypothetical protein [Ruminococcus sp.]
MLKKIKYIVLIPLTLIIGASCSSSKKESSIVSSLIDDSPKKCLGRIVIYNGDLNDKNNPYITDYTIELDFYSKKSTYVFSYPGGYCELSQEKGDEFFNKFQNYNLEEYEPYHANEDGIMITKYEQFTVETFNYLKNPDNTYSIDQEDADGHFFSMSEEDYNAILNDFKELEQAAIKSTQTTLATTTHYVNYEFNDRAS